MLQTEEEMFERTLEKGLNMFERIAEKSKATNTISAENIHLLYTTYGFPDDLTRILAEEKGMHLDLAGFQTMMEKEREDSRKVMAKGM